MSRSQRFKIAGLDDAGRVAALRRSLGLVANVDGVTIDAERGEAVVIGAAEERLVVVHLANEGFEARPVHNDIQHPKH